MMLRKESDALEYIQQSKIWANNNKVKFPFTLILLKCTRFDAYLTRKKWLNTLIKFMS